MELNLDIYVDYKDKRYKAEGYYGPSVGDLVLIFMDMELEGATVQEVARIEGSEIHLRTPNGNEPSYRYMGQYLILKPYGSSDPRGDILVHEDVQYVRVDAQAMPGDLIEALEPNKLPFSGKRFKYRPAVLEVEYVLTKDEQVLQLENGKSYSGAYRVLIPRMGVLPPKTHIYTTHKHVFMEDVFVLGNSYELSSPNDVEMTPIHAVFTGFSKNRDEAIFVNPYYNDDGVTGTMITVSDLLTGKWDITPLVPKKGV